VKRYRVLSRNAIICDWEKRILKEGITVHELVCNRREYIRIGPAVFEVKKTLSSPWIVSCVFRYYCIHVIKLTEEFECSIEHKSAFVPYE